MNREIDLAPGRQDGGGRGGDAAAVGKDSETHVLPSSLRAAAVGQGRSDPHEHLRFSDNTSPARLVVNDPRTTVCSARTASTCARRRAFSASASFTRMAFSPSSAKNTSLR